MIKIRICILLLCSLLLFTNVCTAQEIETNREPADGLNDPEMNCTKNIKFTSAQLKRLDYIYYRIYKDYIDLIETYAWAGALSQDQKQLRYKMLSNYIDTFHARKYRWCSEHEPDEWEEEWYNSDNED
ncbi:DUF2680 domain-containing protein [Bacillus sp. V5-8f]|uniref:DUF2680 domain-containing protein n=1 Tax=Bacillus sp. V5-8f TaxID=2053044 RepID=UPI000C788EE0|nr:DUF2680 domain-containing protein [Bacillus sp. V5-8f]PLT33365.1 DUF2680 domain-containing protein [Bacillus sp. V5-8f]